MIRTTVLGAALMALSACFGGGSGDRSDASTSGDALDQADAHVASDAGPCESPLDETVLGQLSMSIEPNLAMKPGSSRQMQLGTVECCYFFEVVNACASWSVSPSEGATIDPGTGYLEIDSSAENGAVYTVTADVEDGRRDVSIDIYIYSEEDNPLFGFWHEDAQFECGSGEERTPEETIGELRFRADGQVNVTWYPFEVYVDYWGPYEYDLVTGALTIEATGGNYVPDDIDGTGTFEIDDQGRLLLHDMWLGSPQGSTQPAACGHRFVH